MREPALPRPAVTEVNREFFDGASRGELRLQRCASCGEYRFPPSSLCPACLTGDHEWRTVSGRGVLWSWIVMHRSYFPGSDIPYLIGFVQLAEGPFMMTRLVAPDDTVLRCDLPVRAVFAPEVDGFVAPQFAPVGPG